MPAYEYLVLDTGGKQRKGVLEGDSPRHVRQQLREKGLVPLSVEPTVAKESGKGGGMTVSRSGLSATDLALVTRQMATLIAAGLPLEESLKAVSKQSESPRVKSMMLAIRSRVVEGHSLAQALSEFPRAFPELYRATVAAGEHSGHLDLVLEQLADYSETRQETQKKVQMALLYPVILTIFSILIVIGLLTFVVPKIVSVFSNSGQELPLLTRILIATSDFVQNYGIFVALALVLGGFLFSRAMREQKFRYKVNTVLLRLPLAGRIIRGIDAARVASTLSILSKSGVPLVEALRIAGQVAANELIRNAVNDATVKVREGSSLHIALDQCGYFPPMMIQMIASGEQSGELDNMLDRAARNQEKELEGVVSTIVGLFEPLMLVVMGVVVLLIVLAIMLPIISLNNMVG